MFRSILQDIKDMLKHGSMLNKLVIVNIMVFVVIGVLIRYLIPSLYGALIPYFALSSDIWWNLKHPWVFITHMFVHDGLYHIFWNMLLYYWFGTIIGDLIGDKKILPLFIYGGLTGAIIYIISYYFVLPQQYMGATAVGASAAVMATVVAAGVLAPDYKVRLILVGPVSIKYIVVVLLLMDMIGTAGNNNTGGHFAHLGGALFGWFFISNLKRGVDLSEGFNGFWNKLTNVFRAKKHRRSPLRVSHRSDNNMVKPKKSDSTDPEFQKKLDGILDKINKVGYDQLTDEEKEFLFLASKNHK
jgi:membrane associated rhomboid family serine protease